MMQNTKFIIITLAICIMPAACAPQMNTAGNEKIMTKSPAEIKQCTHLGNTKIILGHAQTLMSLTSQKMGQALTNEAQTIAVRIGADTIVTDKKSEKNSQSFRFYICLNEADESNE